jgi:hypothetical protein
MKRNISIIAAFTVVIVFAGLVADAAADLSPKEARRLIARVAGINLPSDAVRVKEVSSMGSSAVVVAEIETAFRLEKGDDDKWRVAEIRTGDNQWENIDTLMRAVNAEKAERAKAELETVATALEAFKRERGFYVESKSESTLIDHLNPRYLPRIVRVDPWHKPYIYEGTQTSFTLRSSGMDGKDNTPDDLVVSNRN